MKLNGEQSVDIIVEIYDDSGNAPTKNIRMSIIGYLKSGNILDGQTNSNTLSDNEICDLSSNSDKLFNTSSERGFNVIIAFPFLQTTLLDSNITGYN